MNTLVMHISTFVCPVVWLQLVRQSSKPCISKQSWFCYYEWAIWVHWQLFLAPLSYRMYHRVLGNSVYYSLLSYHSNPFGSNNGVVVTGPSPGHYLWPHTIMNGISCLCDGWMLSWPLYVCHRHISGCIRTSDRHLCWQFSQPEHG